MNLKAISSILLFFVYKFGNLFFVSDATIVSSIIKFCVSNSFSKTALFIRLPRAAECI